MRLDPINRRTLLTAGGVAAGGLVLGLRARAEAATLVPPTPEAPLAGPMLAWVVLDLDRGGRVRLLEMDRRSQPVRALATEELPLLSPIAAARRAHDLAMRTVAASWGVPREGCVIEAHRVAHNASGRSIGYAVWTDFA